MDYSQDLLKDIEKMGKDMMNPQETSVLLGIEENKFLDDVNTPGNPARQAYLRGYCSTVHDIKEGLLTTAVTGSPYATQKAIEYLSQIESRIQL